MEGGGSLKGEEGRMGWRCLKVSHVAGGDPMDGERERSAVI